VASGGAPAFYDKAFLQVGDLLLGRVARDRFLLQRFARAAVRFILVLQGGFDPLQLGAQLFGFVACCS
jgi:hypothetical protein